MRSSKLSHSICSIKNPDQISQQQTSLADVTYPNLNKINLNTIISIVNNSHATIMTLLTTIDRVGRLLPAYCSPAHAVTPALSPLLPCHVLTTNRHLH